MEALTAQQSKMVIEYFAAQAAEDYPDTTLPEQDKHMWITRMQASLAIERQITEADWDVLVAAMSNLQSFDRDPDAYLHERGHTSTVGTRAYELAYLEDQVSWSIDRTYGNAGA